MKDRILNNLGLKIGSVAIALILWLVVVSIDDPTITRSFTQVPVELLNTEVLSEKGNYFEVDDNTDTITIIATGKRSIIDSLSRDNFRATADIFKLDGTLVPIEIRATKYADRLDSVTSRTSNLRLSIEGLSVKQMSIDVATEGEVGENCILGNISMDRSAVKVSGPESVIDSIKTAEVVVDITGLSSDITTSEKIVFVDDAGKEIHDDRVSANITDVKLNIAVWGSKEVPIVYGYTGTPMVGFGVTGDIYATPSSIKIAADKDKLNSLSEIVIPSSAVDINGAMSDMDVPVDVVSYLPSDVALYGGEDSVITVHVGISALLSKNVQIKTANISIANIPEGMSASIAEPNDFVVTTISGIGNNFINFDENTVVGSIDLSGYVPSTEEDGTTGDEIIDVPVTFDYPAGIVGSDTTIKILISTSGENPVAEDADGSEEQEAESPTED